MLEQRRAPSSAYFRGDIDSVDRLESTQKLDGLLLTAKATGFAQVTIKAHRVACLEKYTSDTKILFFHLEFYKKKYILNEVIV